MFKTISISFFVLMLYTSSQAQFSKTADISAGDKTATAYFGNALSISGNLAVVGANGENSYRGSVYVYEKTGSTWNFKQKLVSADLAANDYFGASVVTNGTYIIAGAYGKGGNTGAVYVFGLSGGNWVQLQKLTSVGTGEGFGFSLALNGTRLIIGALYNNGFRGAAYVYNLSAGTWVQQQKIVPADVAADDLFGTAVATNGTQVVITSAGDDVRRGSAYVYGLSGGTWTQQQKLVASDGVTEDNFGQSLVMSGNTMIVGAYGDDSYRGAAYRFSTTGSTWTQQQKITATTRTQNEGMGYSMSLSGTNLAIAGAGGEINDVISPGAAYIFSSSGGTYTQQQRFVGAVGEWFGSAVAINGGELLVGIPLGSPNNISSAGLMQVYESDDAMPVLWDAVHASLKAQSLEVSWTTLSETNNDHYEVELSANGIDFTPVATIASKAADGNSSVSIKYSIKLDTAGITTIAGLGILSLLGMAFPVGSRKMRMVVTLAISSIILYSCTKADVSQLDTAAQKIYVRIAQVDKDGTKTYSKTVLANREN